MPLVVGFSDFWCRVFAVWEEILPFFTLKLPYGITITMAAHFYDSPLAQSMRRTLNPVLVLTFALSLVSIFLQQIEDLGSLGNTVSQVIDSLLAVLILFELVLDLLLAPYPLVWLRKNPISVGLSLLFLGLFAFNVSGFVGWVDSTDSASNIAAILIIRNLFLAFKVFTRIRRISQFLNSLTVHPAQTLALSFLMVILVGTFYLMLPFTTIDGQGLGFIDALFTTTSAVCVTGLIVVDTATHFTLAGQIGILVLIQIGGLGIMILSFSASWALRKKFSLQDKLMLSYMTNEEDLSRVSRALVGIISLTLVIEFIGAVWLFFSFLANGLSPLRSLWYGVFHSVSAFCNAGFALFSNSFESYVGDVSLNLALSFLIICGGLSFAVMTDLLGLFRERGRRKLQLNSRIVLIGTAVLLGVGMLLIYGIEYPRSFRDLPIGQQYLASFFQSVTLRTAGFNTVSFASFGNAAIIISLVLMFIGGASGSTAGGIKVNSAVVLVTYFRSRIRGQRRIRLFEFVLGRDTAANSILLFIFGIITVLTGMFFLSLSEQADFTDIAFETVSAFATVGVSRGLTPLLSNPGRIIISLLMFVGRVGPLTMIAALAGREQGKGVYYPETEVLIG